MPQILVVDDEQSIREFFQILFTKEGWETVCVSSGEQALEELDRSIFDLVISDISMPGMSGVDLLKKIKQQAPETAVILVTAYGDTESAVAAMKQGAADYILKPFKIEEIKIVVRNILERASVFAENRLLKMELKSRLGLGELIGKCSAMQEVYQKIKQLAKNKSNVLIIGGSGTGKELVARAVHDQSVRKNKPFVTVNCGAIPENLIESELFGHMKGSFTGAVASKKGLMEVADEGTFFFDEVGELPLQTQVKLLRVIQERKIRRVGGTSDIPLSCRIIAATNRNLEEQIKQGHFREDLYYRLNVFAIQMPPLEQRRDDIPLLVQHFIDKYRVEHDSQVRGVDEEAMELFKAYSYPGNVRELSNLVEQALAMSQGEWIDRESLPTPLLRGSGLNKGQSAVTARDQLMNGCVDLDQELQRVEKQLISEALAQAGGVKKDAAKLLKISFRSIRYRLSKLGLAEADGDQE